MTGATITASLRATPVMVAMKRLAAVGHDGHGLMAAHSCACRGPEEGAAAHRLVAPGQGAYRTEFCFRSSAYGTSTGGACSTAWCMVGGR